MQPYRRDTSVLPNASAVQVAEAKIELSTVQTLLGSQAIPGHGLPPLHFNTAPLVQAVTEIVLCFRITILGGKAEPIRCSTGVAPHTVSIT
jgi:hypothetical protein